MKTYVWESKLDNSITVFGDDNDYTKNFLENDAILIRTIEGVDWNDCMKQHHEIMGWEEYKPFLDYYCDNSRHLVCEPYSIKNLHRMAKELNIKKCWFHKNHYDIPKRRIKEIQDRCLIVSPKEIVKIIGN